MCEVIQQIQPRKYVLQIMPMIYTTLDELDHTQIGNITDLKDLDYDVGGDRWDLFLMRKREEEQKKQR